MKKTVAYYRSSTKQQENSVPMQRSKAVHYSIQHKIPIDEEYSDEHISARKITLHKRPDMKRLWRDIEAGVIGKIIVYKRDRLARNLLEHLELYQHFQRHNVKVYFTSDNEIAMYYTAIGEYIESILGAMSEHEGHQIAERIMNTRITNFMNGKKIGNLPFGYKATKEKDMVAIEKIEEELQIVSEIYDELLNENPSKIKELFRRLNAEGKLKRKTKWSQQLIIDIVQNPLYMGIRKMVFKNESKQRSLNELAIVTEKEWTMANDTLERLIVRNQNKKRVLPLDGLIRCEECGKILSGRQRMKRRKKYFAYECKDHCVSVDVHALEKDILEHAKQYFKQLLEKDFERLYERSQRNNIERLQKCISIQEQKISLKEDELSKVVERWMKKETAKSSEEMLKLHKVLKEEKKELNALEVRLYELENMKRFMERWFHDLKNEEKFMSIIDGGRKEFYEDIMKAIYVNQYEYCVVFKYPSFVQEVRV